MDPGGFSRRATLDLPKPETGLAEWTNKIKALQRQVDADEEAEQRRLEEEIVSARRARFRRSRGAGYGDDNDLTASPSALGGSSSGPSTEELESSFDKKRNHDNALLKLTESSSRNVDDSSITQGILPRQSHFPASQPPSSHRQEPVSLASFIGGRAAGPRLNRHAPQQDAHDPTQFEQRKIDAPHPIFGKGGVAMPGMVTKPGTSLRDAVNASEAIERYQPRPPAHSGTSSVPKPVQVTSSPRPTSPQKSEPRDRTSSSPSVARKYVGQVDQRPTSPQKIVGRERTLSTPGSSPKESFHPRQAIIHSTSTEGVVGNQPKSSYKDRLASTPSRSSAPFKQPTERPNISRQSLPSPVKSSVSTSSLARPILPEPRPSFQAPVITTSPVPSPAFNRVSPTKDPTPSISRLQGRGFVQNMVRASSQLETPTKQAPSAPVTRPTSARKSTTVLDRWQSSSASPSPASVPRQTSPVRKAFSELAVGMDTAAKSPATPSPADKVLRTKRSRGLLHPDPLSSREPLSPGRAKIVEKMLPPEGSPGFGSATTMVVYKPKTPEPQAPPEESEPPVSVDELGVRRDSSLDNKGKPRFSIPSELPNPSGKPLNHPTKERARKPKKARDASGQLPSHTKPILEQVGKSSPLQGPAVPLSRSPQLPRVPSSASFKDPSLNIDKMRLVDAAESSSTNEPSSKVTHITQMWGQNALIGVKPIASPSSQAQAQPLRHEVGAKKDPNLIRRALPGLTAPDNLRAPPSATKSKSPSPESTAKGFSDGKPTSSSQDVSPSGTSDYTSSPGSTEGQTRPSGPAKNDKRPISPSSPKHKRIPSTGNRALVMDVAQALNDYNGNLNTESTNPREEIKSPIVEVTPEPTCKPSIPPAVERRRSSYDRFSLVSVMPPLKEEVTPNGTLTRTSGALSQNILSQKEISAAAAKGLRMSKDGQENVIHLDVDDAPLPIVDVDALFNSRISPPLILPEARTISVDVLAINGVSSTVISQDADIFYDEEILAIVHRYKSKTSGLVSTQLWIWYGRKSNVKEKEERKLQELTKRYNTSPIPIYQSSEPPQLVQLLGGQLIIRQGNRSHWSADNTAMYSVRKVGGVVHIDEHDLSVKNLCSAFSYCLNILDTVYIWHGCGSTESERRAAVQYSSRISKGNSPVIQLHEGDDDADDLFWMTLGDTEYAKADYWQWRRQTSEVDPRIWRVDANANPPVSAVLSLRRDSARMHSVYILDCIWEFFVMVGHEARGDRRSIKLGLRTAKRLAETSAFAKPFTPTVHVLVLPSQLPLDLRLTLRELDDAEVNNQGIPDHMNLLSAAQAENHLQRHTWDRVALQDQTMLPLGVSASVLDE